MLLQCVVGAAGAVAAAAVVTRLTTLPFADLAAGLLVAVHPGLLVYTSTKSHPLVFDALFFTLTLLCTMRLAERMTLRRAVTLGAVVGLGALSRGTIVIFLPVAGLWLLLTLPRAAFTAIVTRMIQAGVVASVILAPWVVRSSLLHDRFVFILTTDSEDFWRGNNPWATGHSYAASGQPVVTSIPPAELADLHAQPDELSQARWFSTHARAFVRENPGAFVRLTLKKFYAFWWFAPQTGVLYSAASLRLYQAYYVAALILAAIGTWAALRGSSDAVKNTVLLLAFLAILSGLQSLYYVEGRHRWAVEPMLLALSGCGAGVLLARVTGRAAARA
jgi:4-amino-4-deoxy-L-arabinose transferase-like glycosyltransferase